MSRPRPAFRVSCGELAFRAFCASGLGPRARDVRQRARPWPTTNSTRRSWAAAAVTVSGRVDLPGKAVHVCSIDGCTPAPARSARRCPIYDHREREWRHLDTPAPDPLHARCPAVQCPPRVVQRRCLGPPLTVHAAVRAARHRLAQEAAVTLSRASSSSAGTRVGPQARQVARGLARRGDLALLYVGVDEKAFSPHEYVTVVSDSRPPRPVRARRPQRSLEAFWALGCGGERERSRHRHGHVAPYIQATLASPQTPRPRSSSTSSLCQASQRRRRPVGGPSTASSGARRIAAPGHKYRWLAIPSTSIRRVAGLRPLRRTPQGGSGGRSRSRASLWSTVRRRPAPSSALLPLATHSAQPMIEKRGCWKTTSPNILTLLKHRITNGPPRASTKIQ